MFQLDDKFLSDVGLADLPAEQKQEFLNHTYLELERRVGEALSEGLSEGQLSEFEAFIDRDEDKVRGWFTENLPEYNRLEDFQKLKASAPDGVAELDLLSEYGSLKWLEINRPDYKQTVADEMAKLKQEIVDNHDAILGQSA
ncbi:MAG TPA: DUF5663 domain-containing protein [Candidatus Saccharimonadales bacterium]|nr:DUF5663 domain-containing protein [Candidatus Saccharimonadales bacterium]